MEVEGNLEGSHGGNLIEIARDRTVGIALWQWSWGSCQLGTSYVRFG